MTHEDFVLIEKELDIVLPERYKKIALQAPLKETEHPDAFYDDPRKVIRTNLRLRKNGIYGSEPLRKNHLVVGFALGEYTYIDVSSDKDVYYLADKTKTWHYTPEDDDRNSMHSDLSGRLDMFLLFHESTMRRKNTPPDKQEKWTTEKTYAVLMEMWEDNQKQREEAKKQNKE